MGKMILAACFITDFGTVLALGTLFANYNLWLLLFVIVTVIVLWFMPRWTQSIITPGCNSGERARSKTHLLYPFLSRRSRHNSQKRSSSARLSTWSCRCRRFSSRQNTRASDAQHRVCNLHAVLFHQGRPVRLAARTVDFALGDQRVPGSKDGDQNRRRVSACSIALHEGQGSQL